MNAENKKKLESYRHVVLYAKGHYLRVNLMDDIRTILAHRSGIEGRHIPDRDIYEQVITVFIAASDDRCISDCFRNIFDTFTQPDAITMESVIRCMFISIRQLTVMSGYEYLFDIGEPDFTILPDGR